MANKDYYDLLGAKKGATEQELKSAFRKRAKELHPDRNQDNPEAEKQFKELNQAYEVLKDPQKRAAYDQYGEAAFEQGGFGGGGSGGFDPGFGASMSDIFDDLFGDFMGGRGGGGRSNRQRGDDLRYNMTISLEDAYKGKSAEIKVPTTATCDECSGSGAKKGTKPSKCSTCHGVGKVRAQQGFFTIERACPSCEGRGEVISDPCGRCRGNGRVRRERTLSVTIPAGVEDGTRIRLAGEGDAGVNGGQSGDLYIFLSIDPHKFFQRDGSDIFCRVPISMATASLGGAIEVPAIDGTKSRVKIPEGTQTDKQFRLKGKGMPVLRATVHGDMYIQVAVETPKALSKKQKDLLKEFDKLSGAKNNPESEGFLAKVKSLF